MVSCPWGRLLNYQQMKHEIEIDGMYYGSEGSMGKCETRRCDNDGLYFDEDGRYLCEECLEENHEKGLYN